MMIEFSDVHINLVLRPSASWIIEERKWQPLVGVYLNKSWIINAIKSTRFNEDDKQSCILRAEALAQELRTEIVITVQDIARVHTDDDNTTD